MKKQKLNRETYEDIRHILGMNDGDYVTDEVYEMICNINVNIVDMYDNDYFDYMLMNNNFIMFDIGGITGYHTYSNNMIGRKANKIKYVNDLSDLFKKHAEKCEEYLYGVDADGVPFVHVIDEFKNMLFDNMTGTGLTDFMDIIEIERLGGFEAVENYFDLLEI